MTIDENLEPDFSKRNGLVPAVVQDSASQEVLMLGWVNREAWNETLKTGLATFWSTSRDELWVKGATSGDRLVVDEIRIDCDLDTLLFRVTPQGKGACHTKNESGRTRTSCFFRSLHEKRWINIDP